MKRLALPFDQKYLPVVVYVALVLARWAFEWAQGLPPSAPPQYLPM